jgi:prepilin-type N-terminal cleavage/methylation domain-containing protein
MKRATMQPRKGFSLIELLIVVAIILIIAAIAIPSLLRARIAANESSAASCLRTIKTAEYAYYSAYPTVGYAVQLQDLGGASPCTASSLTACLIDTSLSTAIVGSTGKGGYFFGATGINSAGVSNGDFVTGATPVNLNQSGSRNFCSTSDGILRSNPGVGGIPVTTVPACLAYPVAQ